MSMYPHELGPIPAETISPVRPAYSSVSPPRACEMNSATTLLQLS